MTSAVIIQAWNALFALFLTCLKCQHAPKLAVMEILKKRTYSGCVYSVTIQSWDENKLALSTTSSAQKIFEDDLLHNKWSPLYLGSPWKL